MSRESLDNLEKASRKATSDGIQHFVVTMKDGKLEFSGSHNFVRPLVDDLELCSKLESFMLENTVAENVDIFHATNKIPHYALLPCSPYSPQWKGSANIRKILTEMLNVIGYKAAGRKKTLGNVQLSLIFIYFKYLI